MWLLDDDPLLADGALAEDLVYSRGVLSDMCVDNCLLATHTSSVHKSSKDCELCGQPRQRIPPTPMHHHDASPEQVAQAAPAAEQDLSVAHRSLSVPQHV
uniref:Uncharacterized protein n=1 Tax=Haptolina brevifila TaxID=156173 RepID=A0A7S2FVN3_9EUKA|mmetsp:Transcript_21096/g.42763  ORF Transcript_21096/g.42763 Transcript_21096/m.42763 type:complete len:100 (+) Transcript_21096:101-400(+)